MLLTLLFAYDGMIMGMPPLNFWKYLVLPHVFLAVVVVGVIWKRGLLHKFPIAYVIGFAAFLTLAMVHQQNFLRNQNDWRGTIYVDEINCRHKCVAVTCNRQSQCTDD
jgi:hypothetical protein